MKKVLIIQQMIPHYRIPVFNMLNESYNLTVWAEDAEDQDQYDFTYERINYKDIGPFIKIDHFQRKELNRFDHVIFTFNIRIIDLYSIIFQRKRKYKLSLWGIGVSSEKGFDLVRKYDKLRAYIAKRADNIIFYSDYPISRYKANGVEEKRMFVAHNTLDLVPNYFKTKKEYFLFVGTLKRYKRINHLVDLYYELLNENKNILPLHIIGDGDHFEPLKRQVEQYNLTEKIILHGQITDPERLKNFYKYAVASISPSQAGLSVLQSLAMGVPFITKASAITGGERLNIIDGYNGYLVKDDEEFKNRLLTLSNDSELIEQLGINAYQYFKDKCSLKNMVDGFKKAIIYA